MTRMLPYVSGFSTGILWTALICLLDDPAQRISLPFQANLIVPLALAGGMMVGGFIFALLSDEFPPHDEDNSRFIDTPLSQKIYRLIGSAVAGYGLCLTGDIMSVALPIMSAEAWLVLASTIGGGCFAAKLLYGGLR